MSSVRHDWYQTDQKVVIDVLVKNANNRKCSVDIQPNHVSVSGDDLELRLDLEHEIDTTKSSFRILSVKIEITLQKLVGDRWTSLTKSASTKSATVKSIPQPQPSQPVQPLPDQKKDKNWDLVVKDVWEKEEIEKVMRFFNHFINEKQTISNCSIKFPGRSQTVK